MRAERIVFYSLLGICLFGGLLTGERVFFLVLFIQSGILLLCFALNLWTVHSFSYVQTVDREELTKGETFVLHLRIHNDMPYPFTMMRVHVSAVSRQEDVTYSFALPAHGQIEFSPRFLCAFSGRSEVGMSRVEIEDVFGLTRLNFNMLRLPYYRKRPVLVYPRVHELSLLGAYSPDDKNFSGTSLNLSGTGENFAGVREYREGDAQKRIHWKTSVRANKLYTRVYEHADETHCFICIDTYLYGVTGEHARLCADMLCETAATVAYHALAGGHTVRLCRADAPQTDVFGGTLRDFARLHRYLALLEFSEQGDEADALQSGARAVVSESGASSAYLLTLGNAHALGELMLHEVSPTGGITVFSVSENGKRGTSVTGGIRSVTVTLNDSVTKVLEELL